MNRRVAATVAGLCRSDPFDLEPALEEPVLNFPLALTLGHLHELTNKVPSRDLVHLVVLHPVATRPDDVARVRIEEGAIVWVRFKRVTPDDPRRVIRMPEEKPIRVSLQPQRLHAPHTAQPPPDQSRVSGRRRPGGLPAALGPPPGCFCHPSWRKTPKTSAWPAATCISGRPGAACRAR